VGVILFVDGPDTDLFQAHCLGDLVSEGAGPDADALDIFGHGVDHVDESFLRLLEAVGEELHVVESLLERELRVDSRHDEGQVQRLGDIIVGALFESLDGVVVGIAGGHHDDGQLGQRAFLSQSPQDFESIDLGHHDVEQHEVEGVRFERLEGLEAALGGADRVPFAEEVARQDVAVELVVIDDEDRPRGLRCLRCGDEILTGGEETRSFGGAAVVGRNLKEGEHVLGALRCLGLDAARLLWLELGGLPGGHGVVFGERVLWVTIVNRRVELAEILCDQRRELIDDLTESARSDSGLFQIGEFSLVLGRLGVSTGSIGNELYSLVLAAAVVTMLITPLVSGQTARLYAIKKRHFKHENLQSINLPESGLRNHLVIAGGGTVGLRMATLLKQLGLPFVIIEIDQRRFEKAKNMDIPVVFGDAGQEIVLEAANVSSAVLLVITGPGFIEAKTIVERAKELNPAIDIVARASGRGYVDMFKQLDISEVVVPEFEVGIELMRKALIYLNMPVTEIHRRTETLRQEMVSYSLKPSMEYKTLTQLRNAEQQFDLQWVKVCPGSSIIGKSIGEAEIRKRTGSSVVGVIRGDKLVPNPDSAFRFNHNDLIAIIGTDEAREAFKKMNGMLEPVH